MIPPMMFLDRQGLATTQFTLDALLDAITVFIQAWHSNALCCVYYWLGYFVQSKEPRTKRLKPPIKKAKGDSGMKV